MRIALTLVSMVILLGCSEESNRRIPTLPTAPSPPAQPSSTPAWLWGMVVDESGICIEGATATVVGGQAVGQTIAQTTPCDAWAYDGGFFFRDLTPGVEMTIRATAPGRASEEQKVMPSFGSGMAVLFSPARAP